MSKRLSLKKIDEKVTQSKRGSSAAGPTPAQRVVIIEKRPREDLASSPSKNGKVDDSSKEKEAAHAPEAKKKAAKPGLYFRKPVRGREAIAGIDPPADKEKMEKLTLDQMTIKLFHVISQVQAVDELAKVKVDQDSLADKLKRSRVLVEELREKMAQAKTFVVEEFKSSLNFLGAVKDAVSKYFSKGFHFCKRQLCRHHPGLTIDLEGVGLNYDQLSEEEEKE
ncbi:hypothetical protein Acr_00g0099700 [Actinidia rufa]|uniref:Uncharacterized protein n=1 Tax=Actinidia rufa TaxID=165716 RepID=A0A7J0DZK8_9ERIC|nr:hypothetical protein Acr_00g0099700 [Actinidia rufa]